MIGNKKLYNRDFIVGVVLIILAIIIPFIFNTRYIIGQMTLFFIWATVVSQWNLVFGVAGIFCSLKWQYLLWEDMLQEC